MAKKKTIEDKQIAIANTLNIISEELLNRAQEISKSVIQEVQVVSGTADDLTNLICTDSLIAYGTSVETKTSTFEFDLIACKVRQIEFIEKNTSTNAGVFGGQSTGVRIWVINNGFPVEVYNETVSIAVRDTTIRGFINILDNYLFKNTKIRIQFDMYCNATSSIGSNSLLNESTLVIHIERNIN